MIMIPTAMPVPSVVPRTDPQPGAVIQRETAFTDTDQVHVVEQVVAMEVKVSAMAETPSHAEIESSVSTDPIFSADAGGLAQDQPKAEP